MALIRRVQIGDESRIAMVLDEIEARIIAKLLGHARIYGNQKDLPPEIDIIAPRVRDMYHSLADDSGIKEQELTRWFFDMTWKGP